MSLPEQAQPPAIQVGRPEIPPGKPEAPVPVLVARWMLLGCGATLAVVAVAFLFWMFVVIRGVSQ
jgi:hypothetical protein